MWAAVLFLAAAMPSALADEPSYQEGVRLYEQVDLEGAIAKFNLALAVAGASDVDKASLHAWIALSQAQLGRTDDAMASFRAAVKLDRHVKLPALAPPDVEKQLESARAELPAQSQVPAGDDGGAGPPVDRAATGAGGAVGSGEPSAAGSTAVAPTSEGGPPLVAVITGGAGVALLLAGAATFALGVDTVFRQAFEAEFNDEARALVNLGYIEYAVAGGLAGAGLVGVGAAVVFALE